MQRGGMPGSLLLDDRSVPDFRDHYLRLLRAAEGVSVAISRIRLGGLAIDVGDLLAPTRIRVMVMELSGLTLAMEAERLAEHPRARERLAALVQLLDEGRLQVRSAPLGGWAPDFTAFRIRDPGPGGSSHELLVGPHSMERPYPHRGPALASRHGDPAARRVQARFEELWNEAHDVGPPVRATLASALARCAPPALQASLPRG
jgi:hypothetical protein